MKQTVVLNIVGLSASLLKDDSLFMTKWIKKNTLTKIKPMLPAVTCAVQSTYLTGKWPSEHGIVANGWYFKEASEVKLWSQSNHLVKAPKIWDLAKQKNPEFTCSNMFWWYNMYSNADFTVTPRPQYRADGQKKPDCYTKPAELRDRLQAELGTFPLFNFWGPNTNIKSSKWIADASILVHDWNEPTLQLIYLPHLDYVLQKSNDPKLISKELKELDVVFKELIEFYEAKNVTPIVLSEYGINPVKEPFHINRLLRKKGYLAIRVENGLELLDNGECAAFALADHQVAHVYVKDKSKIGELKELFESCSEIELILDEEGKKAHHLDHERSGDLVLMANKDYWFTYYFWLDDKKAPDYARMVAIHNKPGYDPVELFTDPKKKMMMARIALKILKKKLGFRTLLNVIPLDATLVKGSHGCINSGSEYDPILVQKQEDKSKDVLEATDICDVILNTVFE